MKHPLRIHQHLARAKLVRALFDQRTLGQFTLRYGGPANPVVRIADQDIQMGQRTIEFGERAFVMPSAAHRDPNVADNPDQRDITRRRGAYLTLGVDVRYCLGATLARLEGRNAIPQILTRLHAITCVARLCDWKPILPTREPTLPPVRLAGE